MNALNLVRRWVPLSAAVVLLAACSAPKPAETAAPLAAIPTTTTTSASSTTTTSRATTEAEVTTTVTEVVAVPFAKQTVDDGALDKGRTVLRTAGRPGSKTVTWTVRTRGRVEVSRAVSGEKVTAAPVDEITAVGTKVAAPKAAEAQEDPVDTGDCDPNYEGACVPIASDVDCAGGKGNGPAYVRGPVQVVGRTSTDWTPTTTGSAASSPPAALTEPRPRRGC
jgi:resuscitation-promoting factor RpfB